MSQTLFTNQVPATPDAADGSDNYSLGTYINVAVDGFVTHIRWYYPASAQPGGLAPKARLFRTDTSSPISPEVVMPNPGIPGAWNQVQLPDPVAISAGQQICPAIWSPLRYVATSGFFASPVISGDLTAPSAAGRFISGASGNVDFPTQGFNSGGYFVDVVFETDLTEEPEGPTVTVWNGTLEVNATITTWNGTTEVAANITAISS